MPSLEQQAERARRTIKNGFRQHPMERDIIVLWGMRRGWGTLAISRHIECGTTTVRKVRNKFYKDPNRGVPQPSPVRHTASR